MVDVHNPTRLSYSYKLKTRKKKLTSSKYYLAQSTNTMVDVRIDDYKLLQCLLTSINMSIPIPNFLIICMFFHLNFF